MRDLAELPVVVVGAGPVGLAAAAHLAERQLPFAVVESGDRPGAAVAEWGHVRLFSPWRYNIDAAAGRLLAAAGWRAPDLEVLPTGRDLVTDYLAPLAALPGIAARLRYGTRVVAVSRFGLDRMRSAGREATPFLVRLVGPDGAEDMLARAVIDASGTWRTPNVLGASGLPAHGEREAGELIAHALPEVAGADRDRYAGRHTVVVGAGHSAATTLLALAELAGEVPGTEVSWVIRAGDPSRAYGGGDTDELPARGALGSRLRELVSQGRVVPHTGFLVQRVERHDRGLRLVSVDAAGVERGVAADRVVAATGFRPDHTLAGELRLDLDPILGATRALAPLIDPNLHSCGTVPPHGVDELAHPEPGYFAVGMKSYGRAPTFLMATGYEQVRSVVAALAGDWEAARQVRLELPETGVCSSAQALELAAVPASMPESGCCGN
ncbi:MAG: FAD-dependent oxidoreductase [Mycobacteriales bacterium]